ncbi:MAG: hypothetical protein GYB33_15645 [Gammaproteobacteria bacterium]|nr:hypothetical protein [Gammaproteobacteria bacterium]
MSHSTASRFASTAQPVLFIPHGAGPCFFMGWNPADAWDGMAAYLKGIAASPEQRRARLSDWSHAPHAYQCHPPGHEERLMPLMVAAGAAGDSAGRKVYSEQVLKTRLSAFRFD